jgi:hypothetical protein
MADLGRVAGHSSLRTTRTELFVLEQGKHVERKFVHQAMKGGGKILRSEQPSASGASVGKSEVVSHMIAKSSWNDISFFSI